MKKTKTTAAAAASNVLGSLLTTVTGAGLAALNLWANGASAKQIGLSAATLLLGALAKNPGKE